MTTLREAAQQGCDHCNHPLYAAIKCRVCGRVTPIIEPEIKGDNEPVAFDHGIGADRFKVVRGAFWWHVLIGDSPTEHGKFRSRASAEKMAADLLREFRNGAFVQHEAALAEPVQEPVAYAVGRTLHWHESKGVNDAQLYLSTPQRKPLTEEEILSLFRTSGSPTAFARAVERAHGIT